MLKLKDILKDDESQTRLPDNIKERLFKKILRQLVNSMEKEKNLNF